MAISAKTNASVSSSSSANGSAAAAAVGIADYLDVVRHDGECTIGEVLARTGVYFKLACRRRFCIPCHRRFLPAGDPDRLMAINRK